VGREAGRVRFLRRLVLCGGLALVALAATDVPGSDQPYSGQHDGPATFVGTPRP